MIIVMNESTKSFIKIILVIAAILILLELTDSDEGFKRDKNGSIISRGNISAVSLRAGDCFNDLDQETQEALQSLSKGSDQDGVEVDYVEALPCTMSHNNEVYATSETFLNKFDSRPSGEEIQQILYFCLPESYKYLGIDASLSNDEKFIAATDVFSNFLVSVPTKDSWEKGDRRVSCFIHTELPREESVRNLLSKK